MGGDCWQSSESTTAAHHSVAKRTASPEAGASAVAESCASSSAEDGLGDCTPSALKAAPTIRSKAAGHATTCTAAPRHRCVPYLLSTQQPPPPPPPPPTREYPDAELRDGSPGRACSLRPAASARTALRRGGESSSAGGIGAARDISGCAQRLAHVQSCAQARQRRARARVPTHCIVGRSQSRGPLVPFLRDRGSRISIPTQ